MDFIQFLVWHNKITFKFHLLLVFKTYLLNRYQRCYLHPLLKTLSSPTGPHFHYSRKPHQGFDYWHLYIVVKETYYLWKSQVCNYFMYSKIYFVKDITGVAPVPQLYLFYVHTTYITYLEILIYNYFQVF